METNISHLIGKSRGIDHSSLGLLLRQAGFAGHLVNIPVDKTIDGIPMNIEFKLLLLFRRKDAHSSKFSPRECGHLGLELHLGSLDGLVAAIMIIINNNK